MLTKVNANQAFNGFLRVSIPCPESADLPDKCYNQKVKIVEEKFDKNGKIINSKKLPSLTLNTDHIVSVHSKRISPMGGKYYDNVYVNMTNGSRYTLEHILKKDFDEKLQEAVNNSECIVDIEA